MIRKPKIKDKLSNFDTGQDTNFAFSLGAELEHCIFTTYKLMRL